MAVPVVRLVTPPKKKKKEGRKNRKYGRNKIKCARYRLRVGKPRGPGMEGNRRH